jgi:hypothetical protein
MPIIRLILFASFVSLLVSHQANAEMPSLKMLVLMPGPVIEAHADEERNCDACHGDFDKSGQSNLCLNCHEHVAEDQLQAHGFHGQSPAAVDSSCKSCHKEHKGRDFNSIPLDPDTFDHENTDFSLVGRHADVSCDNCHAANDPFHETPTQCSSCHEEDDPHLKALGDDCESCHSSEGWGQSDTFNHDDTDFTLEGGHADASCASCHGGQNYTFESTQCIDCHQVQDVHLGRYGDSCDRCHSETEWTEPKFDHAKETDYTLTGAHTKQPCRACHSADLTDKQTSTECVSCHVASDIHAGRHGESCDSCHQSDSWEKIRFDHKKETAWPLQGEHEALSCIACHKGELDDEISGSCVSCHSADSVHGEQQLENCGLCHNPSQWNETANFDHELTQFPLEGMHAIAQCEGCHQDHEFHKTEASCNSCHEADDTHKGSMGDHCAQCHNPNAWTLWTFDHDKQAKFDLLGAHSELSCDSCHDGDAADDVPTVCAGCHAEDDRHRGGFGDNCGRCHSSDSFEEARWTR